MKWGVVIGFVGVHVVFSGDGLIWLNLASFESLKIGMTESPVYSRSWFEGNSVVRLEFGAEGSLSDLILEFKLRCHSGVFLQLLYGLSSSQRWHRLAADSFTQLLSALSLQCWGFVRQRLLLQIHAPLLDKGVRFSLYPRCGWDQYASTKSCYLFLFVLFRFFCVLLPFLVL